MVSAQQYLEWYDACHNSSLGIGEFLEHIIEKIYSHVLLPGDSAIDCGANRGRHTFPIHKSVAPGGLVIGIEALPALATKLLNRIRDEQLAGIEIINQAIGSAKGRSSFAYVKGDDAYSGVLQRRDLPERTVPTVSTLDVPMTTLDCVIEELHVSSVRFVKMDLEGGEYDALRGASAMLRAARPPLIVFENGRSASADLYGYSSNAWFKLFSDSDYHTFDLFGRPFSKKDWLSKNLPWYFIAAKRTQDMELVNWELPNLVESVYSSLTH
jgi:FkbM family methyltransferase